MIKTILFDFFGVFTPDAYSAWLQKNGLTRTGDYLDVVQRLDNGIITREAFREELSRISGHDIDEINEAFQRPPQFNKQVVDILKQVAGSYKVALTSNGTSHTRELLQNEGITSLFDEIFISSEMGLSKPDQAFFEHVLAKMGSTPEETVLIDDSAANIASAASYGMHAIHVNDEVQIIGRLKELGVNLVSTGDISA